MHWPYLSIFAICSLLMLVAALSGVYFDFATMRPEILGYCSSLPRDSRYIYRWKCDGWDSECKIVEAVRVKLWNVGEKAVGRIAFDIEGKVGSPESGYYE